MDYNIINIVRSIILLIPGLVLILFPKKAYAFQIFLVEKLHIKYYTLEVYFFDYLVLTIVES